MGLGESAPFVGLSPFEEKDAWLFFGRDRDARLLSANAVASKLTVVYGPSGVGKSSLLNASVLPLLVGKRCCKAKVFRDWHKEPAKDIQIWLDTISSEPLFDSRHHRIIIILDQFEEYLLYWPGDITLPSFLKEVFNKEHYQIHLVFSIREDALAFLDKFESYMPGFFDNRYRLYHLDCESAKKAILGPIEALNKKLDPTQQIVINDSLVSEILNQIQVRNARIDRTPTSIESNIALQPQEIETTYLQLVMLKLWLEERRLKSRELRIETFRGLGGAELIVKQHLDNAMAILPLEQKSDAASIFRFFASPGGIKKACTLQELYEYTHIPLQRIECLIQKLASPEFRVLRVIPSGAGTESAFELFHDALVDPVIKWRRRIEADREKDLINKQNTKRVLTRTSIFLIFMFAVFNILDLYAKKTGIYDISMISFTMILGLALLGLVGLSLFRLNAWIWDWYRSKRSSVMH